MATKMRHKKPRFSTRLQGIGLLVFALCLLAMTIPMFMYLTTVGAAFVIALFALFTGYKGYKKISKGIS